MSFKSFCGGRKIFLIFTVIFLNFLFVSQALAASTNYVPLVNIPGVNPNAGVLTYLSGLYNFLISVVGILAMAVIIYGGMRYLTSAGNPSSVEEAKDAITSAITGLILALVSWLILSTINPDILVLKSVGMSGGGAYTYSNTKNVCVANSTGDGTAANPCVCADGATVYTTSAVGPVVTGVSIAPCSVNVPTATSTITIIFSEPMDPASISNSTINTYFPGSPPVTIALTSPTIATITIGSPYLAATSPQEIIVTTGVKSAKGVAMNAATCSAAAGSPPAATTAYDLRFTTDTSFGGGVAACVSCAFGSSNPCEQICSDQTLANDKAYHCLKAGVRIGWVPGSGLKGMTPDQKKAIATNSGTDSAPFIATQGQTYIVNMVDYSNPGVNLPVKYYFDTGPGSKPDGTCDPATDTEVTMGAGQEGWKELYADIILPLLPICQASVTPRGMTCGQKFCIVDSKGNRADTTLYYTVLDDPTKSPNISPGP